MKSRRETIGWWIALGMLPIAAFAVVSVWVYGYSNRYRRFCDDFAASVASAQGSGRMTAVCGDVTTRITRDNADHIYREITGASHHGYASQLPAGECVELDFGNGDAMTVWPGEGGADEGLTVRYRPYRGGEVIVEVGGEARYENIRRLVSAQWGNEQIPPDE